MTSRDFWYGVAFSLTALAKEHLDKAEKAEEDVEKDRYILRASILIDLRKAVIDGLDRELEYRDLRQDERTNDRKMPKR